MNASMHRYSAENRFRLLASDFFLLYHGIDSPTSWLTPSGQRRKLRCPKSTTLSNSARSFPVLLCASRRLQGGLRSPSTELRNTQILPDRIHMSSPRTLSPWSSRALQHPAEKSEKVSEAAGRVSFRAAGCGSAQGISGHAVTTDCGTGPAFFGYFLCRGKESNSPSGENSEQHARLPKYYANSRLATGSQL